MPDPSDSPELATVIRGAIDARMVDLHTAMPGRVEAYDKDTQTADIRPQFKRVMRRVNGERVAEELPVIPCVPVQWPRGGGFAMTMPLAVGDFGMLILQEYSIDRWRSQGEQVDPADERRHGLSGAVFVPGLFPSADALADADNVDLRMGKDGGVRIDVKDSGVIEVGAPSATESIALGDIIKTHLDAIKTYLDGHIHTTTATISTGSVGVIAPPLASPSVPTVASKHKVEP